MREIEGRALEALLIRTLSEQAEAITLSLTPNVLHRRFEDHRRRRVSPGRRIVLLGLAAVLLLPIGAFIGGWLLTELSPRLLGPTPGLTALPQPTELPTPGATAAPTAPVADRYQALVLRPDGDAAVIVAVRGDRQERVIASVPMTGRLVGPLVPSPDGWLAVMYQEGSEFVDLRDPERAPVPFTLSQSTSGWSWHPDGRFATWDESGLVHLFDPATGADTPFTVRGPLNQVVAWTADGSALLARGDSGDSIFGGGERIGDPAWRVIRLDGGPDDPVVPDLDLGLLRNATFGQGGARLQICEGDCPEELGGGVVGEARDGTVAAWYRDELAPDEVDAAIFGGDGTGMWLLLDRRVGGRQFVIARANAAGAAGVVAVAGLPAPEYGPFRILGVSADDSLIAVNVGGQVLVETATGRATPFEGELLGFIPSATADTWARDPFRAVEPAASLAPVMPAYAPLPPLADLVGNQLLEGDRELWRQEYFAIEGQGGTPTTTEIGPLDIAMGLGVVFACSGPSDALVTMEPDSPMTPVEAGCDSDDTAGGQIPWWAANLSARFVVTSSTDSSWQIVIFDPAPE